MIKIFALLIASLLLLSGCTDIASNQSQSYTRTQTIRPDDNTAPKTNVEESVTCTDELSSLNIQIESGLLTSTQINGFIEENQNCYVEGYGSIYDIRSVSGGKLVIVEPFVNPSFYLAVVMKESENEALNEFKKSYPLHFKAKLYAFKDNVLYLKEGLLLAEIDTKKSLEYTACGDIKTESLFYRCIAIKTKNITYCDSIADEHTREEICKDEVARKYNTTYSYDEPSKSCEVFEDPSRRWSCKGITEKDVTLCYKATGIYKDRCLSMLSTTAEQCLNITNKDSSVGCIKRLAIVEENRTICKSIEKSTTLEEIYKESEISFCEKNFDSNIRQKEIDNLLNGVTPPEKSSCNELKCINFRAVALNDTSICDLYSSRADSRANIFIFEDIYHQSFCKTLVTHNPKYCYNIDNYLREQCFIEVANYTGNWSWCDEIKGGCGYAHALNTNNATFCKNTSNSDSCFYDVALQTDDIALCYEITEQWSRDNCLLYKILNATE